MDQKIGLYFAIFNFDFADLSPGKGAASSQSFWNGFANLIWLQVQSDPEITLE